MTIGRNADLYALLGLLVLLGLVAVWTIAAQGATSIEVQIGFNGHVVPERYAPVRIRVHDFSETAAAHVLISQTLGSPWRGTATVLQEPALAIVGDGLYHTTIPVYDPLNPIFVTLVDGHGGTLAAQEVDLRSTRHLDPFPVVYGTLPYPLGDETLPVANASGLPGDWWAYDVVQSLWISAAPPQRSWNAIARWVYAGGTTVLLSGPDYFRFDSPIVRELLPLADPELTTGPDGDEYLIGTLGTHAQTFLRRDGVPLLVIRSYGSGHVALVTVRAADLTRNEIDLIAKSIPPSTRITAIEISEAALGALPVSRPGYWAAILLCVACVIGFGASAAVGRRHSKGAVASVLLLFALLSVLSGLYANSDTRLSAVYCLKTHIQVQASFGLHIDGVSIVSSLDGQLSLPAPSETVPMQRVSATEPLYALMPQSQVAPEMFEHSFLAGRIGAPMRAGTSKTFYSYSTSPPSLHLAYEADADLLILDQGSATDIDDAWFILDGLGFHVSAVPRGASAYPLDNVRSLRELIASDPDASVAALESLSDVFPLDEGVWMVGQSARWLETDAEVGMKVRLLTLYVVEGERND